MEKKRILIIDDEDTIAHVCAMVLERSGHFLVRSISSGDQAVRTARNFLPHLIILDRYLKAGHGGEVAVALRADAEVGKIPIVFLTGSIRKEDEVQSLFGFPALAKPITSVELIESALRLAA